MATKFTYTDTELAEIIAKYDSGVTLESLAETYNKSVASVRMKLVKQGVYKKVGTVVKAKSSTADFPTMQVEVVKFELAKSKSKSGIDAQFNNAFNLVGAALM